MSGWTWEYDGYLPADERLRESLCTMGNGYFATRGALPECTADDVQYPGTYAAGCYDRLASDVAGHRVENEDMVNLPNWLPLRFRLPGGDWFTPDTSTVLHHRQVLHLATGLLERRTRFALSDGGALSVRQQRLVHMADPHLAALHTEFTTEGYAGELEVEAALDGRVTNAGVPRYRDLDGRHLTDVHTGVAALDTVWLGCRTRTSDIRIGLAARLLVDARITEATSAPLRAVQHLTLQLTPGRTVVVDKIAAVHTSRDSAIGDPLRAAVDRADAAPGFDALVESHRTAWEHLLRRAESDVPGRAGGILRLHLFHVLQTLSPHTADLDVGVPARGLHGEAYRGHVFRDELFVLPFLNLHFPEVSRALIRYRYRRLDQACAAARAIGRRGALYPWQSSSDGRELADRTGLDDGELNRWEEVSRTLHVPFHDGVISQFEGYGDLAELDWAGCRERYDDIRRLDRILEAEGDTVNRYKASEQADVLMLGYLFSPTELRSLFERLGYTLDDGIWARTVDYYLRRTSHGSTPSGHDGPFAP